MSLPLTVERHIVGNLASFSQVVGRGKALLALAIFMGQVKGMVALVSKQLAQLECPWAETVVILISCLSPASFSYGKGTRVVHVLGMVILGYVLTPQVALYA